MSLWRASVSTHGAQDRAPRCMRARHTAFALPGPLLPASMALLVRPAHRLFKSPRMRGMAGTRLGIHATFGWKMRSISGVHPAFSACGRLRTLRTRGGCAHAKIGDLAPCAWVGPHHAAPVACLWVGGGPSGVSSVLNQLLPISLLCNEMGSNHCVWGLRPMSTRCTDITLDRARAGPILFRSARKRQLACVDECRASAPRNVCMCGIRGVWCVAASGVGVQVGHFTGGRKGWAGVVLSW